MDSLASAQSPATILVVDDEPQNRKLLEALLRSEGYLTRTAVDGAEALRSIAEHPPDLIVLDVMMPGMDGYEVAALIKGNPKTSSIPVIMATAQVERSAKLAGLAAGAEDFLTKPIDRAELSLRVRNLLRLKLLGDLFKNYHLILEQDVRARTAELQRFRTAMDAASDGIVLVDRSTLRFIEANNTACTMLGYTREELLSIGPVEIARAAGRPLHGVYEANVVAETHSSEEMVLRRKDGSLLEVEVSRQAHRSGDDWTVVAVMRDISERKEAARALESINRLRQQEQATQAEILNALPTHIALLDNEGVVISVNEAWRQFAVDNLMEGKDHGVGISYFAVCHSATEPARAVAEKAAAGIRSVLDGRADSFSVEYSCDSPLARRFFLMTVTPLTRGASNGAVVMHLDVTARTAAEERILQLNRVYAVLSGINGLIIRARDRDELFRESCRIAVDEGGFLMSAMVIRDADTAVARIAACAGMHETRIAAVRDRLSSRASLQTTMIGRALLDKAVQVSNVSAQDPKAVLGQQHAEDGVQSLAVLPLIVGGEAVGALVLYAGQPEFFHAAELKLLTELADDIAFAIDHLDKKERLEYLAYYDALTGLANRRLFLERLGQYVTSAAAHGHGLALLLIDLARFRNINETLGRDAGDSVLRQTAAWLTGRAGNASLVARVGANHFAVVVPELRPDGNLSHLVDRGIAALMDHPFVVDGAVFRLAAKVGIAIYPAHGADADTLLKHTESALKNAQAAGERHLTFTPAMATSVAVAFTMENRLRLALQKSEFVLHYQPKIDLLNRKLTGAEALIRWNDPHKGLVPPGQFISILEDTGLIHEAGQWALRQAIADYARWHAAGLPAVRIAVNVSALQIRRPGFVDEIAQVIHSGGVSPDALQIEITESVIMADVRHSIATLRAIRDSGVSIAIDDFGTGFSSLAYLSSLPVDTLKIDRSFINDMTNGPEGLALVSTIINLAHALKMKVVAEGVETDEQSRLLRLVGCDEMQGFLLSKAVPRDIFEASFLVPAVVP